MYYSLRGQLIFKENGLAVIECGGVAYEVQVGETTLQSLPEVGQEALLYTRLIVRENELSLSGFSSPQDRRLYDTLITVSGIGSKQGLRILSELSGTELRNAIVSGDSFALNRVKGVGKKTADRIILELKDKMAKIPADTVSASSPSSKSRLEVVMALRVLGYSDSESQKAIDSLFKKDPILFERDTEVILKDILASMASS